MKMSAKKPRAGRAHSQIFILAIRGVLKDDRCVIKSQVRIPCLRMFIGYAKEQTGTVIIRIQQNCILQSVYGSQQQQFIVESLPGIGAKMAKNLLETMGSVKSVFNATEKRLKKVDKLGEKKAREIRKTIEKKYEKESNV